MDGYGEGIVLGDCLPIGHASMESLSVRTIPSRPTLMVALVSLTLGTMLELVSMSLSSGACSGGFGSIIMSVDCPSGTEFSHFHPWLTGHLP